MARPQSGFTRLVPATIKVDPELKSMIEFLAARERRSPSSAGSILLQFAVMRWIEKGNIQRLIDETDKGWGDITAGVRKQVASR